MRQKPWFARLALMANIVGTLVLMFAFQTGSSDFRLITRHNVDSQGLPSEGNTYAICVENHTLAATDTGGSLRFGSRNCAEWADAEPTAVVTADYPSLWRWGFRVSLLGFLLQLFVPVADPEDTLASVMKKQHLLKAKEKLLRLEAEQQSR